MHRRAGCRRGWPSGPRRARQAAVSSAVDAAAGRPVGLPGRPPRRPRAGSAAPSGWCRRCCRPTRAVLVGAGDPVDAEARRRGRGGRASATAARSRPAARGRRRRSKSASPVAPLVADDGVGDVGVDVEGGRPGRPVARALLAARWCATGNAAPGEAEHARPARGPASRVECRQRSASRGGLAGRCRSAPAARRSRCPRRRARRSPGRSAPWPGSPAARRGRRPAGRGTARSAPPAAARRRRRPRRRRSSQNSSR